MEKLFLKIGDTPAILWGKDADRLILAVHGKSSHKSDDPIALLAAEGEKRGYQVLSFDLPGCGERTGETSAIPLMATALKDALRFSIRKTEHLSVFGVSLGAYLLLSEAKSYPIENAYFLSPVVDMNLLIASLLKANDLTPKEVLFAGTLVKNGQTYYAEDLRYATAHPIDRWPVRTQILYGENDAVSDRNAVEAFTKRCGAKLTLMPGGEHWFHTPQQLCFFKNWIGNAL